MTELVVRTVSPEEFGLLQSACSGWGYSVDINPRDTVFLAEEAGQWLGLVRRACENDVLLLRTMLVSPEARGRGVATQLLEAFVGHLGGRACYCLPYRHLTGFYGRSGFVVEHAGAGPPFLEARLARYRADGLEVVLMRRPPE